MISTVESMAGRRMVVVGDVFLDEYVLGKAERLSREAPVPVIEFRARQQVPGGGANPTMNLAALGATVAQIGVVGDDAEGAALRSLLAGAGVDVGGLIVDASRPTITKTRIVAEGELRFPQQLARVDRYGRAPLAPTVRAEVEASLRQQAEAAAAEAILFSDYRAGLIDPPLVAAARALAAARPLLLTADTQGELEKYRGFTLLKCNRGEAEAFWGRPLRSDDEVAAALTALNEQLEVQVLLITRGARGLSVGVRGGGCRHLSATNVSEVYDVTGAGDTVIAVASLALVAGADAWTAAALANVAGGLAVRRMGNAAVSRRELSEALGAAGLG